MSITVVVVDSLEDLGADEFHALDDTVGALGSRGRLMQHTGDPRWEARYVVALDGDRLVAAVPIFLGHGDQWSDQIHFPADWGYDGPLAQEKSALVGGRLEIRGSLRCVDSPDVLRAVSEVCRSQVVGREVFLGYLDPRQQRLAEALFGPVRWTVQYEDFDYPRPVVLGPLADLRREVRQAIRHGERKIAEFGVSASVVPWSEYTGTGCDLIAAQNKRKGMTDHGALVRYRLDQWAACEEVSVFIVHATMGDEEGAVSLLVYRDEVEVYEVGLPEGDGAARRTLYTCLTFDEPRRLAREHGYRKIRAGLGAGVPKKIRGAQPTLRGCGVVLP
ncbi:hypothetical protein ACOBQX_02985 [Actinokineospora sp. G85]|uniref:hypothetical protein n=1 Tax=Actinokineospora sp. G85 TaxID=3406626 RepID=UPI003C73277F